MEPWEWAEELHNYVMMNGEIGFGSGTREYFAEVVSEIPQYLYNDSLSDLVLTVMRTWGTVQVPLGGWDEKVSLTNFIGNNRKWAKAGIDDLIFDQKDSRISDMAFGVSTVGSQGCGAVAVYNIMVLLGQKANLADIIYHMEMNGALVSKGVKGAFDFGLISYLESRGVDFSYRFLPGRLDTKIKQTELAILAYQHSGGGHYITVQYSDDEYKIYNDYVKNKASIDAWLKEKRYFPTTMIGIRR